MILTKKPNPSWEYAIVICNLNSSLATYFIISCFLNILGCPHVSCYLRLVICIFQNIFLACLMVIMNKHFCIVQFVFLTLLPFATRRHGSHQTACTCAPVDLWESRTHSSTIPPSYGWCVNVKLEGQSLGSSLHITNFPAFWQEGKVWRERSGWSVPFKVTCCKLLTNLLLLFLFPHSHIHAHISLCVHELWSTDKIMHLWPDNPMLPKLL